MAVPVPQKVAPTQTLAPQQVPTAQISPVAQSLFRLQLVSPAQEVDPSTQKPVLSAVVAQTQEPPGPQGPKLAQVWPVQVLEEQAPLVHLPEGHWKGSLVGLNVEVRWEVHIRTTLPQVPQFLGSVRRSVPLQTRYILLASPPFCFPSKARLYGYAR